MRGKFLLVSWGIVDKTVSVAAGSSVRAEGVSSPSAFSVGGFSGTGVSQGWGRVENGRRPGRQNVNPIQNVRERKQEVSPVAAPLERCILT